MNRSSHESVESTPLPSAAQGLLCDDDLPVLDEEAGYRGPTVCKVVGITYRRLDYWARTDLVTPSIRNATGSGSQRLHSFPDNLVLTIGRGLQGGQGVFGIAVGRVWNEVEGSLSELPRERLPEDDSTLFAMDELAQRRAQKLG